jgi:hypothetical protein
MGRGAIVLAQDCEDLTTHVACHPSRDLVAAVTKNGFAHLARFQDERLVRLDAVAHSAFTCLRWSASGQHLIAGTESGLVYSWAFVE